MDVCLPCFPFGIFIVIIAIIIPFAMWHAKHVRQQWKVAAERLGLQSNDPGMFGRPRISGTFHGLGAEIYTITRGSGKNKSTYTCYRISFPQAISPTFEITKEGFFSTITKWFGTQDLEIGDAEFDSSAVIKGHNVDDIRRFLTPTRRMKIRNFLMSFSEATVSNTEVSSVSRGVETNVDTMVRRVHSLYSLASSLIDQLPEDKKYEQALKAQKEGDLQQAITFLGEAEQMHKQKADDEGIEFIPMAEEKSLEGEIYYLADKKEEAHQKFESAHQAAPDNPEFNDWANADFDHMWDAEPTLAAQPKQTNLDLNVASVCNTVFQENQSSIQCSRIFEKEYQDQIVEWSGELTRTDSFSYDLVFGDTQGCKGVIQVYELNWNLYGDQHVNAIVQFPSDIYQQLNSKRGQQIRFQAKLKKADGFLKNFYLTEGKLLT